MVKNHKKIKSPKKSKSPKKNKNDGWMEPPGYGWNQHRDPYWNPGYDRRNAFRPGPIIIPPPPIFQPQFPISPSFPSQRIRVIDQAQPIRIVTDFPIVETSTPCTIL